MSPSDLFQKERTDYFRALESCLADIRETYPEAVSEVLVELNTPELPRPYRLMRPDILYKENEEQKICRVVKDEWISFDPLDIHLASGVPLTLHPFQWDRLQLKIYGEVADWLPFEAWVARWLDVEDVRSSHDVDYAGLIHHVTQPALEEGFWWTCVDMGSANLDALNHLFEVLGTLPVQRIELGHF